MGGKKASKTYNLITTFPDIAKQWHPTKNGNLLPQDVTPGMHKKVWWKCSVNHEWEAVIYSITSGNGCPFCAGKKVSKQNNIKITHPDLAKLWHPTKNGSLTPEYVTFGQMIRVWWKCSDDGGFGDHEWKANLNTLSTNMAKSKTNANGCPFCAGKKASKNNNLETTHPRLVKEWDFAKNNLLPGEVTYGSGKKVWWICEDSHTWKASIHERSCGNGCPICNISSSQIEGHIYEILSNYFVVSKEQITTNVNFSRGNLAVDILIPDLSLVIEYDGAYWHKDRQKIDLRKSSILEYEGYSVIRLREHPLEKITKNDISISQGRGVVQAKKCVKKLLKKINLLYGLDLVLT